MLKQEIFMCINKVWHQSLGMESELSVWSVSVFDGWQWIFFFVTSRIKPFIWITGFQYSLENYPINFYYSEDNCITCQCLHGKDNFCYESQTTCLLTIFGILGNKTFQKLSLWVLNSISSNRSLHLCGLF